MDFYYINDLWTDNDHLSTMASILGPEGGRCTQVLLHSRNMYPKIPSLTFVGVRCHK